MSREKQRRESSFLNERREAFVTNFGLGIPPDSDGILITIRSCYENELESLIEFPLFRNERIIHQNRCNEKKSN